MDRINSTLLMAQTAKKKILLVQSAQTQGNSTKRHLEETGYAVLWAGSGISALMMARNETVDLILVDVALPDIEGLDLCRRFRARDDTRSIPIILLTQRGYAPERAGGRGLGPDDLLAKPYAEQELDLKISTVLARQQAAAQPGTEAPAEIRVPAAPETAAATARPSEPRTAQPVAAVVEQRTLPSVPVFAEAVPVMKTLQQQVARPDLRLVPKPEPESGPAAAVPLRPEPERRPLLKAVPPPEQKQTAPAAQAPVAPKTVASPAMTPAVTRTTTAAAQSAARSGGAAVPASAPPPAAPPRFTETADAVVDPDTGLFGRKQFEAMFSKEYKRSIRFKQQMSCMLIDLDGRAMGRTADAKLVKAIIGLVNSTIREIDTAAWWTGDAFIVMLPNTLRNDAVQAGMRILEAVANHPFTWPDATNVAMSIGVAGLPDKNITSEERMIEAASAACRRARDLMNQPSSFR